MSLPAPTPSGVLTQWSVQPVGVVLVLALTLGYVIGVRRMHAHGQSWSRGRSVAFGIGVALLAWTSCGFLQAYSSSLFWAWTTQTLLLMLIVPIVLMSGQPLHLARAVSPGARWIDGAVNSGLGRALSNPLVGPALVPLLSAVLFFGPVAGFSIRAAPVGWAVQLVLLVVGTLIALPLIDTDLDPSSLAVGLALAIGSFELVLDAVPGIVLRLHTTTVTSFFDHRAIHSWSPVALHDQQIGGTILWCLAEVIDLPFLLLVFLRWLRADARDAAAADAVLEAERAARAGLDASFPADGGETAPHGVTDEPWWLSDPAMRNRLRRRD